MPESSFTYPTDVVLYTDVQNQQEVSKILADYAHQHNGQAVPAVYFHGHSWVAQGLRDEANNHHVMYSQNLSQADVSAIQAVNPDKIVLIGCKCAGGAQIVFPSRKTRNSSSSQIA